MRVLHVNDLYEPAGGTEIYLFALLDAVEARQIETVVVHEHPARATGSRRRAYQLPGLVLDGLRPSRHAVARLAEILREEQPDVIHLHKISNPAIVEACMAHAPTVRSVHDHNEYCPGGAKYLPAIGRVCGKPFGPLCIPFGLLTHCTSQRPRVLLRSYVRTRGMAPANRSLPVLVVASQYVKRTFVQNGYSPDTVKALPYFVRLPRPPDRGAGENGLLFVGRVVPQKGLDSLLRCLRHVRAVVDLVVAGDGPDLGRVRRLATTLGLGDRVKFVGWATPEQTAALYRRASVVVVPSIWPEPFGIVGIEAMSHGKPVVAFDVGGISDWLEDGVTGYLVRPYDVDEMALRIDHLLQKPGVAHALGARGRQRVERDFTEERHVASLLGIYQDLRDG